MFPKDVPRVTYLYMVLVSSAYFVLSSTVRWLVPAVPRLMANETAIAATEEQVSWIVAAPDLVLLATCVPLLFCVDLVGRKVFVCLALLPQVALWLAVMFASSAEHLLAGAVVGAVGSSVQNTVVPVLLVEMAPVAVRGAVASFRLVSSDLGALLCLVVGPYLTVQHFAMLAVAFPLVFLVASAWIPESPYYLLLKGRAEAAEKNLKKLRGKSDVREEIDAMKRFVEEGSSGKRVLLFHILEGAARRRSLLITALLTFARQLSGSAAFDSYSTFIFRMTGSHFLSADYCSMIIVAVGLCTTVVTILFVDLFGRRPLLLLSCAGCAAALFAEGAYFAAPSPSIDWLPLAAHLVFRVSFGVGLDSLPAIIAVEVFPAEFKGIAMGISTVIYSVTLFVQGKVFPLVVETVGLHYVLWFYACCSVVSFFLIFIFVLETKSKPFEQIQAEIEEAVSRK